MIGTTYTPMKTDIKTFSAPPPAPWLVRSMLRDFDARAVVERAVASGWASQSAGRGKLSSGTIYFLRHGHRAERTRRTAQAWRARWSAKGFVQMRLWREAEAQRRGVAPYTVAKDLTRGIYRGKLKVVRFNRRVVFVKPAEPIF